jgi:hypothetical protein
MLGMLLRTVGPYALAAGLGVAAYHFLPVIGVGARVDRLEASRDAWQAKATEWIIYGRAEQKAFRESERLRGAEYAAGVKALNETARACDARVKRARASGLAIHAIVTKEVPRDPQGCAGRSLVDPRQLREAVAPAGG